MIEDVKITANGGMVDVSDLSHKDMECLSFLLVRVYEGDLKENPDLEGSGYRGNAVVKLSSCFAYIDVDMYLEGKCLVAEMNALIPLSAEAARMLHMDAKPTITLEVPR